MAGRQPQDLGADYRLYRFTQQRERVNSELSDDSVLKASPVSGHKSMITHSHLKHFLKLELGRKQLTVT